MFSSEAIKLSAEHDTTFFPALKMEQEHDEGVIFQQADFFSTAFPMMDEIRRQGKFCDVILKVDYSLIISILYIVDCTYIHI